MWDKGALNTRGTREAPVKPHIGGADASRNAIRAKNVELTWRHTYAWMISDHRHNKVDDIHRNRDVQDDETRDLYPCEATRATGGGRAGTKIKRGRDNEEQCIYLSPVSIHHIIKHRARK